MVVEIANRVLGVGCYDWKIIAMNIMSVDAVTDERPIFYEAIVQCHGRLRVCRNNGAADDKRSERCVMDSVAYHTEVKPDKARALAAASESAEGLAMAQCLQRLGYDRQDVRTSGLKPVASASRATTVAAPPTTATAPATAHVHAHAPATSIAEADAPNHAQLHQPEKDHTIGSSMKSAPAPALRSKAAAASGAPMGGISGMGTPGAVQSGRVQRQPQAQQPQQQGQQQQGQQQQGQQSKLKPPTAQEIQKQKAAEKQQQWKQRHMQQQAADSADSADSKSSRATTSGLRGGAPPAPPQLHDAAAAQRKHDSPGPAPLARYPPKPLQLATNPEDKYCAAARDPHYVPTDAAAAPAPYSGASTGSSHSSHHSSFYSTSVPPPPGVGLTSVNATSISGPASAASVASRTRGLANGGNGSAPKKQRL